ncbi:MAG: DegT/DnrJ/EryC1/StrS family aminotransferase [Candidatus Aenigmarchaeota archaeon]|nr:DegT/DnrJ/EryC1/StrS family aminotransferase [Candidatus Aenigmarchaeota archaeon]
MKRIIPHSRPTISEDDVQKAASNLRGGKIATGEETGFFEKELSRYIGSLGGVAVNSGTNALFLSLKALGIKKGDEVILPSYVCASVLSAINLAGARPVLADIEEEGYNISPDSVESKITSKTKAVIVPHMFGSPARIDKFLKLKVPIIEDCAQSVGGEFKGKKIGSFGKLSIFSFYATKVFTTGQGGMVTTHSKEILEKLRDMTQYDGRESYLVSYNMAMTDFQAALGRSQLKMLGSFIKKRRAIAARYDKIIKEFGRAPKRAEGSICFRYVVEVEDPENFIGEMGRRGVMCARPIFRPLHSYLGLNARIFPNTEKAQGRAVSVPIYPSMSEEEISAVETSLRATRSFLSKPI